MTREEEITHALDFLADRKFQVGHNASICSELPYEYVALKGNFRRELKDADDLIQFVKALEHVQPKHDFGKYASWKDCWGGGFE